MNKMDLNMLPHTGSDDDEAKPRSSLLSTAKRMAIFAAPLVVIVGGGRERTWQGRLVRTEASVDARTRLVYGIVEVRDPFNARNAAPLAPGMFVSARLEGSSRETMVAAPRSALKRNEYVYVVTPENTIDIRQVRAAQTTADEVLFREGVADGERVVVSVLTSPREGMAVTPIDRAGESQTPAAAQEQLPIRE
ncbi:MAG TPA: hypothetical protein VM915_07870 [Verrucomicrobiae bacterium]|nr:hypothetical protein [Verrucomicrobiae bacterium]